MLIDEESFEESLFLGDSLVTKKSSNGLHPSTYGALPYFEKLITKCWSKNPIVALSTLFYYINTYGNDPQKQNSFIEIQSDNPNDLFSITKNINLIKTVYIKAEVTFF